MEFNSTSIIQDTGLHIFQFVACSIVWTCKEMWTDAHVVTPLPTFCHFLAKKCTSGVAILALLVHNVYQKCSPRFARRPNPKLSMQTSDVKKNKKEHNEV